MMEIDRRTFIGGTLAAAGLLPVGGGGHETHGWHLQAEGRSAWSDARAVAQAPPAGAQRIDIHHHFAPPAWVSEVKGRPLLQPANTRWTPEQSIEDMDRAATAAAVISITNPGLWFGDAAVTMRLARACNEYGASLVQKYPSRFGMFAAMPLPDIDATLKEIAYAYDVLKADGVGLFTSYGDQWLGNEAFRPVMEELNRRRAVVHVHPTAANCCRNLAYGAAPGAIEYGTDTTRALIGVTFSGDTTRFPDIRFIWSHAGGSAPFFAGRIEGNAGNARDRMPAGFIAEAKKCFYDTAGATNRGAIASLLELVSSSQVLFGTDFPPGGTNAALAQALRELKFFSEADLRAVERDNAVRLLPRLKGTSR
jgi:predicted TIM-barrel fold metal-dependent hydrolase